MFFGKKSKNTKCQNCRAKVEVKYNFCPFCGDSMIPQENEQEFGMLGKRDLNDNELTKHMMASNNLNAMDKLLSSMVNGFIKGFMNDVEKNPRGSAHNIKIKIGIPNEKNQMPDIKERKIQSPISQKQLQRLASLPREKAQTNIRRFDNKLIYELIVPGITSPENIFVSRLESGYEIKAIGQRIGEEEKVYVNSLPITLPIKSFTINPDKLLIEFTAKQE